MFGSKAKRKYFRINAMNYGIEVFKDDFRVKTE